MIGTMRCCFNPSFCDGEVWMLLTAMYYYAQLYAAQIFLVTVLSGIAIFRREMSCNHVYSSDASTADDDDENYERRRELQNRREKEWDDLLENTGEWGALAARKPLLSLALPLQRLLLTNNPAGWTDDMSDKVLEGAEPFWSAMVLSMFGNQCHGRAVSTPVTSAGARIFSKDIYLPMDLKIHILSHLHPKDVVSFACCNKDSHALIDKEHPADDFHHHPVWKTLWDRDYAWCATDEDVSWNSGRACVTDKRLKRRVDKRLYFEFGQTYLNCLLAGCNSPLSSSSSCLVGLYGNIYDIQNFLEDHPGSPETLLVHAGQDATATFESVGHSASARGSSPAKLCQLVELSTRNPNLCGVVKATEVADVSWCQIPFRSQQSRRAPGTLHKIRHELRSGEDKARYTYRRLLDDQTVLCRAIYYDAFDRKWKAWYTDDSFRTFYICK